MITVGSVSRDQAAEAFAFLAPRFRGRRTAIKELTHAQPDSINQPPQDGCERNPGGLLAGTSPQWVYVNRDPSPQYAVGTARNAAVIHRRDSRDSVAMSRQTPITDP